MGSSLSPCGILNKGAGGCVCNLLFPYAYHAPPVKQECLPNLCILYLGSSQCLCLYVFLQIAMSAQSLYWSKVEAIAMGMPILCSMLE